ncbi:WXG100-like domain-containing protein [Streptomyces sp. NPDC054961]
MSIKPSEDVSKFFSFLTGMPWPQADEDLMRSVSDNYKGMAADLDTLATYIAQLVPRVKEDFEGEAADAFVASMRDLIGGVTGSNIMQQTSELALQLGDAARNVANQVEYTKIMAILQIVELIVQILFAMIFGPITFGATAINAALQFVVVREGLRNVLSFLLRTILTQTFIGITAGIFQDMVIQLYQLSSGHTDKWDKEHTLEALKGGALNGLVAGPLEIIGHYGGQFLGKLLGKDAGAVISKKIDDSLTGKLGKEIADAAKENASKTTGKGLAKEELNSAAKKVPTEVPTASPRNAVPGAVNPATAGAKSGTKTVSGAGANAGTGAGKSAGKGSGAGAGTGTGTGAGAGAGKGTGKGAGASTGSGTGKGAGAGTGTGSGTGKGAGASTGTGTAAGKGAAADGAAGAGKGAASEASGAGAKNTGTKTASGGLDSPSPQTAGGKTAGDAGKGSAPGTRTASEGLDAPKAGKAAPEAPSATAGTAAKDTASGAAGGATKAETKIATAGGTAKETANSAAGGATKAETKIATAGGTAKETASGAAGSAAKAETKVAAEGAKAGAEGTAAAGAKAAGPDITKLLSTDAARSGFAKDVGKLLGAASGQIEHGFLRHGKGTISQKVSDQMGEIFEKHLAKGGDAALKTEMHELGKSFGKTFNEKWGRLAADHTGLGEALEKSLGRLSGNEGLKNLARDLPDLFTPSKITGNAFTQPFKRMFQTTPLHGNPMYQLGMAVTANLKDGVQNNLSEGFYNLIFSEEHEFTTTWSTFVSGMAMGMIGKSLHKLFEPAMNRYAEWFAAHQSKANPNDSKYFGALHPLNIVSFLANMSGHQAPYPVPRPTSFAHDVTFKQQAKDMVEWVFSHPFTGRSFFDKPLPVLTPEHDADHNLGDTPESDDVADVLTPKPPKTQSDGPASDEDPKGNGDGDGDGKGERSGEGATDEGSAAQTAPGRAVTGDGGEFVLPPLAESKPFRTMFADDPRFHPVGEDDGAARPGTESGPARDHDPTEDENATAPAKKDDDARERPLPPLPTDATDTKDTKDTKDTSDEGSASAPPRTDKPLPQRPLPSLPTGATTPTARPLDGDADQPNVRRGQHIAMDRIVVRPVTSTGESSTQAAVRPAQEGAPVPGGPVRTSTEAAPPPPARLLTRPIRDANGEEVGLSFHHEPDWKLREQSLDRFGGASGVYQVHERNAGYDQTRPFDWSGGTETVLGQQAGRQSGGDLAAPWAGGPQPFFLNLHSSGAGVKVLAPGDHDYRTVTLKDFGTQIKDRVSMLPPGAPLVLTACKIGGNTPELQQFADITGRKVYASTVQTYSAVRPRTGSDESAVGADRYEGVIALVSDPDGATAEWTSVEPRPQAPEAVAGPVIAPHTGPLDPADARRFVRALADPDGAQLGLALPDRLPVAGLHERLRSLTTDTAALDAALADRLGPDGLKAVLPYLLHRDGWPVPSELLGGRDVRLRLRLSEPREARLLGRDHGALPETRVERRAGASNESSQGISGGNRRRLAGTYGETEPRADAGVLAKVPWSVSVSAVHNELALGQNLAQGHQAVQALRSNESSTPYSYKATWVIETGDGRDAGDGGTGRDGEAGLNGESHPTVTEAEPLAVYLPNHLLTAVEGEHVPATAAQLRTTPLWAVAGIGEPGELARLVKSGFEQKLNTLSPESLAEVHHWTSEESLRGGLPIAVSGGFFSPVLHDTSGRAIGFFGLTATVTPGSDVTAVTRSMNLESHNTRFNRYTVKSTLTSSLALEGGAQGNLTSATEAGHPGAATALGGAFGGKFGGKYQASEDFSTGGGAQQSQNLRSGAAHLLVDGTARFTLTFHDGAPTETRRPAEHIDHPVPLTLYVPARDTLDLNPDGPGRRRLPPELERLESLGISATTTRVEGTTRYFDRAIAELTERHYLPNASSTGDSGGTASTDRRTQLMNLHRLKAAWSEFALRGAAGELVDGGYVVRLDDPRPGHTGQIQVRLTAERAGDPAYLGTLSNEHMALSNSVSHSLPASGQRTTAPSLTVSGTVQGNVPLVGTNWQAQGSFDPAYTRTWGTVRGWSTSVSHDQQVVTKEGVALFDVPVTYRLDMSDGGPWQPVVPTPDSATNASPAVITLAVAHDRTTPEPDAVAAPPAGPTPAAPAAPRAANEILRSADTMDTHLDSLTGAGLLRPGVVPLPGDAVVEHVRGAHVLQDVVREMLHGAPRTRPEAAVAAPAAPHAATDLEAQRPRPADRQWRERFGLAPSDGTGDAASPLAEATAGGAFSMRNWLNGKLLGDVLPPGHVLLDSQLTATALLARGHQIFGGTYVVEHATSYGTAVDHHMSLEIKGYLHASGAEGTRFPIVHEGSAGALYTEVGVTHADSGTAGDTTTNGVRGGASLAFKDTGPQAPANAGTPSVGYQYAPDTVTASSRTTALAAAQVPTDTGRHHRVRLNATYEITLRQGWGNGVTNMLGLGERTTVRRVVVIPGSVGILLTPEQLQRHSAEFRDAGLAVDTLLPQDGPAGAGRRLPDRFTGPGHIGQGSVDEVTVRPHAEGYDAPGREREPVRRRLVDLVDEIAPGARIPGHLSYVLGLDTAVAGLASPAAIRSLPARHPGSMKVSFEHHDRIGGNLVEISVHARPGEGAENVAGTELSKNSGLENQTHLTRTTVEANRGTTTAHAYSLSPQFTYPLEPAGPMNARSGVALTGGHAGVLTQPTTRFSEARTWLRTDHVVQFTGVPLEYAVSVRRTPLHLDPLNALGNLVTNLSGRPREASRPLEARAVLRFPVVDTRLVGGDPGPGTWRPGLPLLPAPDAAAGPDAAHVPSTTAFVPVRNFASRDFRLLSEPEPNPRTDRYFFPTSTTHQLALIDGLVRDRGGRTFDASEAAALAGIISIDGGTHLGIRLSNPVDVGQATSAPDPNRSRSLAMDLGSRQGTSSSASSAPRTQFGADAVQRFGSSGVTLPMSGPNLRHSATSAASSLSLDIVKVGKTDAPAPPVDPLAVPGAPAPAPVPDPSAPVQHVVRLDAEITGTDAGGRAVPPVRGRVEMLVTEEDLLGHGLFGRSSRGHVDLHGIRYAGDPRAEVPIAEQITRLRAALDQPEGTARQVWFAAGDHRQSADALYVAHRTAIGLGRPVELVLRGDHGAESYRFDARGDLETGQPEAARALRELFDQHDTADPQALADAARTLAEARRAAGEFSGRPLAAELVAEVFDAADPWEVLKSTTETHPVVLNQPGYATGDQFAIAATLRNVPRLHVAISQGAVGENGRPLEREDKATDIRDFYVASGIDADRIHLVKVNDLWDDKKSTEIKINSLIRLLGVKHAWSQSGDAADTLGAHRAALTKVAKMYLESELRPPTRPPLQGAPRPVADPEDLNRLLRTAGLVPPVDPAGLHPAEQTLLQTMADRWDGLNDEIARVQPLADDTQLAGALTMSNTQLKRRNLPINAGTNYLAATHSEAIRKDIRHSWGVSSRAFPTTEHPHVRTWLEAHHVPDLAGREVIVLWSRFSGKSGGAHLEHDTSFTGVRQIIERVAETAASSPTTRQPFVLIVGDRHADPVHEGKYAEMARDLSTDHVSVHDLTAFWRPGSEEIGTALRGWGGHTRTGQFKLYEYLDREADSARHLGFRSGNLEAMAMLGYRVKYMEEPNSIGTVRMAAWNTQSGTGTTKLGGMSIGYELLNVSASPTRSGKFFEAGVLADVKARVPGADQSNTPPFIYANRQPGGSGWPMADDAKAAHKGDLDKGFTKNDVNTIVRFLLDTDPKPEGSPAVSPPKAYVLDGDEPPVEPPAAPGPPTPPTPPTPPLLSLAPSAGPPVTELGYRPAEPAYHVVSEVLKSDMKRPGAAADLMKRRDLRVTEYESPRGTVLKVESLAHRSDVRVETLNGKDYVRLFQTVYAPDGVGHKDIHQTADGEIRILPDTKDMWVNAGRPWRALHYMRTYRSQGHDRITRNAEGSHGKPIVRSFLVPVETYHRLTSGAIEEAQVSGLGNGHALNTDRNKDSDQYLIRDSGVEEIRNDALPGSLRTYVLDQYRDEYLPGTRDGEVRTLSDMLDELSLPELRDIPELARPLPNESPLADPNGLPVVPNTSPPKAGHVQAHLVPSLKANDRAVSKHVEQLQQLHDLLGRPDLLSGGPADRAPAQAQFTRLAGKLITDRFPESDQERRALRARINRAANYSYMPTVIEAVYKEAVAAKFGRGGSLSEWAHAQDFPERTLTWTEKEVRPDPADPADGTGTDGTGTGGSETTAPAHGKGTDAEGAGERRADADGRGADDVIVMPSDLRSFPRDIGSDYPAALANAVRTARDSAHAPSAEHPARTWRSELVQTARDADLASATGTRPDSFVQSIQDVLGGGSSQAHTPQYRARLILDRLAQDPADGEAIALASTIAAREFDVTIVYVARDGTSRSFGTGGTKVFLVHDGSDFRWSVVRPVPVA